MPLNVTLAIPVYRPQQEAPNIIPMLETLVEALAKHPCYQLNVLLLETQSDEPPLHHPNFQIHRLPQSEFDHGATRSLVQKFSQDDIIIYLTQDVDILDSQALLHLIKAFENPKIGAAYGKQLPYPEATPFAQHLRLFNYTDIPSIVSYQDKDEKGFKVAFLSNAFAAYRREALEKIGWFKAGLILGEDYYAAAQLLKEGFQIAYLPQAQAIHSHNYTIMEEFKRYFDIGVFHQQQADLLEEFGKPEGEGMRYLKSELNFLFQQRQFHKLFEYFLRNFMKYVGYKLGKHYERLPRNLILKFSMQRGFWHQKSVN